MSNDNVYESLYKVEKFIGKLILDGKRDPRQVLRLLQVVVENPDFISILDAPRNASVSTEPAGGWAAEYTRFYAEVFGLEVNFVGVEIPAEQPGFGWVVMIPQGLTLNQTWAKCQERFPAESYIGSDLDQAVLTSDRTSAKAYAKRLRNRVEADEENKSLSADDLKANGHWGIALLERLVLKANGHQGITLLERLVLELWYHWKTGDHLDLVNVTLCAGSRHSAGHVPRVGWYDDQLNVYDGYPGDAEGSIRSRSIY